jgi:hypothetical protein
MKPIALTIRNCQVDGSVEAKMVLVTPEVAAELLLRNTHNRKSSAATEEKYAREISMSCWLPSSAGIGFDTSGVLIDGQTRLGAIVRSKRPAWLLIVTGLPAASQASIDRQRKRSLFDVLHLEGIATSRHEVQVATCLLRVTVGKDDTQVVSDSDVKAAVENHRVAFAEVRKHFGEHNPRGFCRAGVQAACVVAYELQPEKTIEFVKKLNSGENLIHNDPPMRLRKWLLEGSRYAKGGAGQLDDFGRTIYALTAWLKGEKIDRLVTATIETIQSAELVAD